MHTCPHCKQPLTVDPVDRLRQWCRENGHNIFAVDRVAEPTAAAILGRTPGTLRNWRTLGGGVPYVRSGSGRGMITYSLAALADYLAQDEF